MLYCEFDETFKNNFFTEHLRATASVCTHCPLPHCVPFLCIEKFQLYANFCHVSYYKKPIYFSTRKLQKTWFFLMYVISQLFFQIQNFLQLAKFTILTSYLFLNITSIYFGFPMFKALS